jgi:4'-phosphopantetheinyl transferase EntD
VIDRILPPGVAFGECFDDPPSARLWPGEEAAVAKAVEKRRREYTTGRHCARIALAALGLPPAPILTGPNREPLWPEGVVGALTHCDGYRAAAVARTGLVGEAGTASVGGIISVGIDAEPHAPLPDGVLTTIAHAEELPALAKLNADFPDVHWDRLTFSAKESVYKAWYPLARTWLGFEDAALTFDVGARTFEATLYREGPLTSVSGQWCVQQGFIATSVVVSARASDIPAPGAASSGPWAARERGASRPR